jgi:hypothetical protein
MIFSTSQALDIELVFLRSHLFNLMLLNPASMFPTFFASTVELFNLHYKTWQMIMSGNVDSAALQEGPPSQFEQ